VGAPSSRSGSSARLPPTLSTDLSAAGAYLLRSESDELFGVSRRNPQEALSAAPLKLTLSTDNPFKGLDLFETEDRGLIVRS